MHKLYLTGSPRLTREGRTVNCSRKGLALLCYLALEPSQPREQVAILLWEHSAARQNLRVELTKLRSSGLNFPAHTSHLLVTGLDTDIAQLGRLRPNVESEVLEALEGLRGPPLEGLFELGNAGFRAWVQQQSQSLTLRLQQIFEHLYSLCVQHGWHQATALLLSRAEALGLHIKGAQPPPETPSPALRPLHFARPLEEKTLLEAFERSQTQPMLVLLRGVAGSGKTYLADWLAQRSRGVVLKVPSARSSRLVLASLAAQLMPHVRGNLREVLHSLRSDPQDLETDLVRLTSVLERLSPAPILSFEEGQVAPPELSSLFEFWLGNLSSGLFLVLSREDTFFSELTRVLQRRTAASQLVEMHLDALSLESVQQALLEREGANAHEGGHGSEVFLGYANQLLQRSDGNIKHMLTLIEEERDNLHVAPASSGVHDIYLGEAEDWSAELRLALRYLSVILVPFDEHLSSTLLKRMGLSNPNRLLAESLERGVVQPLSPERVLVFPHWTPLEDHSRFDERFEFGREAMRIALASSLPQPTRQELRRHLSELLENTYPGLAGYYAGRAALRERAGFLLERHRASLPEGSPLRVGIPTARLWENSGVEVVPVKSSRSTPPLRELGYQVALERGWLSVRRRGRYGHAETLRLVFALPQTSDARELRLVWRLDTFNGGYDLFPTQVPFPLRVRLYGQRQAQVLSPERLEPFFEDGIHYQPHNDIIEGGWMQHLFSFEDTPHATSGALLELSVRALDVALIVGTLEWGKQELLNPSSLTAWNGTKNRFISKR